MTATTTAMQAYKAARASGMRAADACYSVMESHGLTSDQAAELSWVVETGAPAPAWLHEDGAPTEAARAWDRGHERSRTGGRR